MKFLKDIRQSYDPDFVPHSRVKEIEQVQIGDVSGVTIQDKIADGSALPHERSQITAVDKPKED